MESDASSFVVDVVSTGKAPSPSRMPNMIGASNFQNFDPALDWGPNGENNVPLAEAVSEISHVHHIERVQEVLNTKKVTRTVGEPRIKVTEKVIEIPKIIRQQKIVEVPQVETVDRIVEVPEYIYKERVLEKPKVMIQERIVPVAKRREEKIVYISRREFNEMLKNLSEQEPVRTENVHENSFSTKESKIVSQAPYYYSSNACPMEDNVEASTQQMSTATDEPDNANESLLPPGPIYEHVPEPVEIPVTHYVPVPVETIVDRNVPIPVEMNIVQEFLCPRIKPKYVDVVVPVKVTRVVEVPVPEDALFNSALMKAYLGEDFPLAEFTQDLKCPMYPASFLPEPQPAFADKAPA